MTTDRAGPDATVDKDSPSHWDGHWDRFSEATRLNPGQAFRRRMIFRLLDKGAGAVPEAILDVGCGSGDLLAEMAVRYPQARLAGVDHSDTGLKVTASKFPDALLMPMDLQAEAPVDGELTGWASHAICSEVLEHLHDPVLALKHIGACLRPGGRLVVTVPGGPMSAFDRQIGHLGHYKVARLQSELEHAGYRVLLAAAAGFPTFNLYRMAILLRGDRLAGDIDGRPSWLARTAMRLFHWLMHLSLTHTPWGWQILALAEKPAAVCQPNKP